MYCRLKSDYVYLRAGLYFITICTQNRVCLFGDIENWKMKLNDSGRMIETEWLKLPQTITTLPKITLSQRT